jgi:hypothetical protein
MEKSVPPQSSKMSYCAHCRSFPLPEGRTRFCSKTCIAQWKRERERSRYGHRHTFECIECGHCLRLGRRRK